MDHHSTMSYHRLRAITNGDKRVLMEISTERVEERENKY